MERIWTNLKINGKVFFLIFIITIGILTSFTGCISKDSEGLIDNDLVSIITTENEFFNDSYVFTDGVYLAYENQQDYNFNVSNNTESIHLNYTLQYKFEAPLIGPAGMITITWTFYDNNTNDSIILHQVMSETTTEENGTTVYFDDNLVGWENQTGNISVRINGNGSDNSLTGGSKDFFTIVSEMQHNRIW
jgi:hypothetical protein